MLKRARHVRAQDAAHATAACRDITTCGDVLVSGRPLPETSWVRRQPLIKPRRREVIQPRSVVNAARDAGQYASKQLLRAVGFDAIFTSSAEFFADRLFNPLPRAR